MIKPGTIINDIMSQEDWMPTLLAAAGEPDIVGKLKQGYQASGKTFKIHPDGYNFLPYFKGEVKKGPREEIYYFGQGGELNAVRWNDWKIHFAVTNGNIATAVRDVPGWPVLINLRADPYEKAPHESGMYIRWYADNIWLFVPVQQKLKAFLTTLPEYPFQQGSSLNAANINYNSLQAVQALKRLRELEPSHHRTTDLTPRAPAEPRHSRWAWGSVPLARRPSVQTCRRGQETSTEGTLAAAGITPYLGARTERRARGGANRAVLSNRPGPSGAARPEGGGPGQQFTFKTMQHERSRQCQVPMKSQSPSTTPTTRRSRR